MTTRARIRGRGAIAPALILALTWASLWRGERVRQERSGDIVVDERGEAAVAPRPLGLQAVQMGIGLGPYLMVTRDPTRLVSSHSAENERIVASTYLRRAFPGLDTLRLRLAGGETGAFNLETMLKLRPDIVVTWARMAPPFEGIGLSVAGALPLSSTARLEENTKLFATIVGDPRRGDRIIEHSRADRAEVATDVAAHTTHRPRLLLLLPLGNDRWQVGFGFRDIISAAGGIDVGASLPPHAFLDDERLMAIAPEVIVIIGSPAASVVTPTALMARPGLASVPAVRARRVYATPPGVSGHMMTAIELPIQERWLADILHPKELQPRVAELAARVYETELGATPSVAEVARDLAFKVNAGSLGGGL